MVLLRVTIDGRRLRERVDSAPVSLARLPARAAKAALLARRRVLTGLARPGTTRRLSELSRFEHPLAPRLSQALRRMRAREARAGSEWVSRIEAARAGLLTSEEPLGNGSDPEGPYDRGMTVRTACLASRRPEDAEALFTLVRELAPSRIVELGTNVGISSAYMAAAQSTNGKGTLVTLDASPGRSRTARKMHASLGLSNVEYLVGTFDRVLESALTEPVDFAFIDGHHQFEPTLDYFDRIWRRSKDGAVFVFDDIRWSTDMERAWKRLQTDPRLAVVVDLCGLGVAIGTRDPKAVGRLVTPILAV
jgi:predicted O-methyltransferase YrrM